VSGRPPKLPFCATRVVKAVDLKIVAWSFKGLWLEHFALDIGPEGCFLGATGMGQRVGMTPDQVEYGRRVLVTIGLMVKLPAPRGATAGWVPTLPSHCIPDVLRPSPAQLAVYVTRLESHLEPFHTVLRQPWSSQRTPRQSSDGVHATRPGTPAPESTPLHAQTPKETGVDSSTGLEMLEKVGEKPPTSPPSKVGGIAHAPTTRSEEPDAQVRELVEQLARKKARLRETEPVRLGDVVTGDKT